MQRKTLNASRLQQEVSRRLQRTQEIVDDGVLIGVPRPQHQAPDAGGCNWTMKHFGNAAGFEAVIADVLAQVRSEYNLDADRDEAPAPASSAKTLDDPFGGSKPSEKADPFGESKPREKSDPFGESKPRERANPFGDAGSAKAGDPFASSAETGDASAPPQKKPRRDPFGND